MTKCSKCGEEILDPICEDACPNKLCSNCGEKCGEERPDPVSKKCEECPYEWEEQEEQDDWDDEWYDPGDDEESIRSEG